MFDAEKIDDGQRELTSARAGSAAAVWAVAWSLLVAFLLLLPIASPAEQSTGQTREISVTDRTHFLSLASRDGLRQTLSTVRKSGPHARLDPPVALETFGAIVLRSRVERVAAPAPGRLLHAYEPTGYDCRGPPTSTT